MKIYIVDATGILFRSYYAIRGMSNSEGLSTNAIFGFIRSMKKLIEDFDPHYLVAIFDPKDGSQYRKKLYADYKAHRQAPEDIHYQIDWAKDFCSLYGIPHLCISGYEADDAIASLTRLASQWQFQSLVVSQDKDLAQLINPQVHMLQPHKNNLLIDEDGAVEVFGISPSQMTDYLAIVGDSSDNVPGIKGFGPKTAKNLLERFQSLEGLYKHVDDIPQEKKRQTLIDEKSLAFLSKKLVTLKEDLPLPHSQNFYTLQKPQLEGIRTFYQQLNFQSLLKEIGQSKEEKGNYHIVDDEEALEKLKERLECEEEICFDTEASELHPLKAEIVGVGFSVKENEGFYLPFNGKLGKEKAKSFCSKLFQDQSKGFFAHNAKYDLHVLANSDISLPKISFDTILASYLLFAHTRRHSLDALSLDFFQKEKTSLSSLTGSGKQQKEIGDIEIKKLGYYCCEDCDYTRRLKQQLMSSIKKEGLSDLLFELEIPLMHLLFQMERSGVYVDKQVLSNLSEEFSQRLNQLKEEILSIAGEPFNLNSPKQLAHILFEKLEIPPPKKTKTGYSTNASVLESLKHQYPICHLLLDYRQYEKLLNTYVDALPQEIHSATGRIHSTFNQSVAATGRLSSQRPNFQNIPIKTEEGRRIREAIKPQKINDYFLAADYSQIELRILAHMSEDPQLLHAFRENKDIHRFTASLVFNIPMESVTFEQRLQAKTVNFGILYGQQAFSLSKELGMSVKMASAFIEKYFERYEKVKSFIEQLKQEAEEKQSVTTLIHRKRAIPDITSKNKVLKQAAQRLAVNTPIQGTAADIIKLAMLAVDKQIKQKGLKTQMILQIHDELLFEVPESELDLIKKIVKEAMEGVMEMKVPLVVNIGLGKNWKAC